MGESIIECVRCSRLYRATYDDVAPASDDLVCRCGATLFEEVDRRETGRNRASPTGSGYRFHGLR